MPRIIMLLVGVGLLVPKIAAGQNIIVTKDMVGDIAVHTHKDPITDDSIRTVSVKGRDLILGWGCEEEDLALMIVAPILVTHGGASEVTMRFDGQPSEEPKLWPVPVPEAKTVVKAPDSLAHALTAKAMKARQVTVRVRNPTTDFTKTTIFSLMGLTRALSMLPCRKPE